MQKDERNTKPPESSGDKIIIRSPLRLAIFAIAILVLAAMALALISESTPVIS